MFNGIRDWFSERTGRGQAAHEIRYLGSEYFKSKDVSDLGNPRLKYDGPGGRNTGYIRGYDSQWSREGYRDAQQGRSRSEKFENMSYDSGWLEGMKDLRKKGFRHHSLDKEYERLVRKCHPEDLWALFGVSGAD